MSGERFAVIITCADGEVQYTAITWAQHFFDVPYVDEITVFGPEHSLAETAGSMSTANIQKSLEHAVTTHQCQGVAVIGHSHCSGNVAGKETQLAQIRKSVERVAAWRAIEHVVGAWIDDSGHVEVVSSTLTR